MTVEKMSNVDFLLPSPDPQYYQILMRIYNVQFHLSCTTMIYEKWIFCGHNLGMNKECEINPTYANHAAGLIETSPKYIRVINRYAPYLKEILI